MRLFLSGLLLFIASTALAETRTISAESVLAVDLPGTQDLVRLERALWQRGSWEKWYAESKSLKVVEALREASLEDPQHRAGPMLLLPGSRDQVLTHINALLRDGIEPPTVRSGVPCMLFFYAYSLSGLILEVEGAEIAGDEITVSYSVASHPWPHYFGPRFALFPLGGLTAGEKTLSLRRGGVRQTEASQADAADPIARFICKAVRVVVQPKEAPRSIPLSEVYAYRMPWTRDLRKLGGDKIPSGTIGKRAAEVLTTAKRLTDQSFLVSGTPDEAASKALGVLSGDGPSQAGLPDNAPLWAVFYAPIGGTYVCVTEVIDEGDRIVIRWRQTLHATADASSHLALVPLGRRPAGSLEVVIEEQPAVSSTGATPTMSVRGKRRVCDSAAFTINPE